MRDKKGEYGYIRSEKKRRLVRTVLLFAIAFGVFAAGLVLNGGDRRNIWSIVAAVGCIPGAMSMTGLIMIWLRRPMDAELYRRISGAAGDDLLMLYELYLTTQDKNMFIDAAAVCGEYVMAFTSEKATSGEIAFMEQHIRRSLQGAGYRTTVKIYTDAGKYAERLEQLIAHRDPESDEADRKKAAVLKAIAL